MKNIITCFFVFSNLFFSCQVEKEDKLEYKNIIVDLDKGVTSNYSDFISKINYQYIETKQPNLLVTPYKIVANDSIYFIEDLFQKKIIEYKKEDGSYKIYGNSGEGPGENLELDDFAVDGDSIMILDSRLKKFLFFDRKIGYLGEEKSVFNRSVFYQGKGFRLFYSHSDPDVGHRILRISEDGTIDGFLEVEKWFANKLSRDQNGFMFSEVHNKIYFLLPYTNEVAIFSSLGYLESIVKLNFGKYDFKKENWINFDDFRSQIDFATKNKLVLQISSFIVLDHHFVVAVNQEGGKNHVLIFDKSFELIGQFSGPSNDIDGVKISAIPWTGYSNKIVSMVNSKRFSQENQFENNLKIRSKYSNINTFLLQFKDKLVEDENYVFVEFEIK